MEASQPTPYTITENQSYTLWWNKVKGSWLTDIENPKLLRRPNLMLYLDESELTRWPNVSDKKFSLILPVVKEQ